MGYSTSVYLQIRDWNYWWNVYQFGGAEPSVPQVAEFSLTFDQDGEAFYFAFDFYNLSALRQFCSAESEAFVEPEHPDRPLFLNLAEQLLAGKREFFIGALYYENPVPSLALCNRPLSEKETLFDRKSLPAAPYYAVVFLREDRPLTPEVLISWVERLAPALLGKTLSCRLGWSPSRETALRSYQEEGSPWST